MTGTILVYLKYPEPGRVKTRLAATLGAEHAAELYRTWIGHVLERMQPLRPKVRIVGAFDGAAESAFAPWSGLVDAWWPQPAGELGARLDAGFKQHAANGPVFAIGTDCLELDAQRIQDAVASLQNFDTVFGPANDGGYYLVGMARYLSGFFEGIRWSSPDTLQDHLDRCRDKNWSVTLLPPLNDIDTEADWKAYLVRRDDVSLAVVISAINEAAALPCTLESLAKQTATADRVLIVDCGSRDDTREVTARYRADVLDSMTPGRGHQIAAGVDACSQAFIVVAHADMRFPPDALARIREHLHAQPDCPGGCLGHCFDSARTAYRIIEWFDQRRARAGQSYGDQCQFFRRTALQRVGGFPAQPIMEDVELAARLRKLGVPAALECPVLVSPRRFEQRGVLRTLWQNWRFRRAYRRSGVSATQAIFDTYYPHRVRS